MSNRNSLTKPLTGYQKLKQTAERLRAGKTPEMLLRDRYETALKWYEENYERMTPEAKEIAGQKLKTMKSDMELQESAEKSLL